MNHYKYLVLISVTMAVSVSLVLGIYSLSLLQMYCECNLPNTAYKFHLSSKTPYRLVANTNITGLEFQGCTATKIVGVIRHGTRTPSYKYISGMRETLPKLLKQFFQYDDPEDFLCPEVKKDLLAWGPDAEINGDGEKLLTVEGIAEMKNMAERMRKRLLVLLSHPYSNDSYYFKYTASQRTRLSATSFALGLFGEELENKIWYPESVMNDPILRFYKGCNKWQKEVKKNKDAVKEKIEMIKSDEMKNLLESISRRLGYNNTLTFDDVYLMYMTCSFETAWHLDKLSPWCSVFALSEFETMEYIEDLKSYYIDGYGHQLNHEQACPLVEDIFQRLIEGQEKAVFYFTHSGTILKLLSHLGLYEDEEPLRSETSSEVRQKRLWRTSFLDPFAANVFFILHKCGDREKLTVLHQERLVKLPWCEEDLCPLENVRKHLKSSISECDFVKMCSLNPS